MTYFLCQTICFLRSLKCLLQFLSFSKLFINNKPSPARHKKVRIWCSSSHSLFNSNLSVNLSKQYLCYCVYHQFCFISYQSKILTILLNYQFFVSLIHNCTSSKQKKKTLFATKYVIFSPESTALLAPTKHPQYVV